MIDAGVLGENQASKRAVLVSQAPYHDLTRCTPDMLRMHDHDGISMGTHRTTPHQEIVVRMGRAVLLLAQCGVIRYVPVEHSPLYDAHRVIADHAVEPVWQSYGGECSTGTYRITPH